MKYLAVAIFLLFPFTFNRKAQAYEVTSYVGGGVSQYLHSESDVSAFFLNSPTVSNNLANGVLAANLFFGTGTMSHKNVVLGSGEKFSEAVSAMLHYGLELAASGDGSSMVCLLKLGGISIKPDSDLSDKNSSAFRYSYGVQYHIRKKSAVFVEAGSVSAAKKAEKVQGEPDLFNGNFAGAGLRFFL